MSVGYLGGRWRGGGDDLEPQLQSPDVQMVQVSHETTVALGSEQ